MSYSITDGSKIFGGSVSQIRRQKKSRQPMPTLDVQNVVIRCLQGLMLLIAVFILMVTTMLVSESIFPDQGLISRLSYTAEERAQNASDRVLLSQVVFTRYYTNEGTRFVVGCPVAAMTAADRVRWHQYADAKNWVAYPQYGADCRDP